jgi:hypothetical protein
VRLIEKKKHSFSFFLFLCKNSENRRLFYGGDAGLCADGWPANHQNIDWQIASYFAPKSLPFQQLSRQIPIIGRNFTRYICERFVGKLSLFVNDHAQQVARNLGGMTVLACCAGAMMPKTLSAKNTPCGRIFIT